MTMAVIPKTVDPKPFEQADSNYLLTFIDRWWHSDSRIKQGFAVAAFIFGGFAYRYFCTKTYEDLCKEYAEKRFEAYQNYDRDYEARKPDCCLRLPTMHELASRVNNLMSSIPNKQKEAFKEAAVTKLEEAIYAKKRANLQWDHPRHTLDWQCDRARKEAHAAAADLRDFLAT